MKNLTRVLLLAVVVPLYPLSGAQAQPEAVGGTINLAVDNGSDANFSPALASDPQGNYVAAWTRFDWEGSQAEVVFRKLGPGDRPVTARREANQHRTGWQHLPDVAMNGSGWFAVAWYSSDPGNAGSHVRLYRGRTPVTGEIKVPLRTQGGWQLPQVAIDSSGNFVVAWDSDFDVLARRFDNTGKPLGSPYRVNTYVPDWQSDSDVAMRPDGRHVVVWRSWGGPGAGIYAQLFDAQGRRTGGEIRVHQGAAGTPSVAIAPGGGFVVAWDRCDFSNFRAGCAVLARRYDAAGRPLANATRVSFDDADRHVDPKVAFARNGSFAIAWNLCESDPDFQPRDCRIATRFYDRRGRPYSEVPVVDWDADLRSPAITAVGDELLVAWNSVECDAGSCGGTDPIGVFAQRYRLNP